MQGPFEYRYATGVQDIVEKIAWRSISMLSLENRRPSLPHRIPDHSLWCTLGDLLRQLSQQ